MGSTVSIAAALLLTGVVFLLLPEYGARLADERGPLAVACLFSVALAAIAVPGFSGNLGWGGWRIGSLLPWGWGVRSVPWPIGPGNGRRDRLFEGGPPGLGPAGVTRKGSPAAPSGRRRQPSAAGTRA